MDTNDLVRPATWRETFLAMIPIILLPVFFLLALLLSPFIKSQPEPTLALGIFLSVIGGLIFSMLIGWVKGFPRWVFPYWGFILLITLYLRNFSGTIAGYWVDGGWWAWTPVVAIAMLGTLWARGFHPVRVLFQSIWKDWTLLSFIFYGALPLLFLFAYDEVHNEVLARTLITLLLSVGAIFYMRSENTWHRFASLVGGFTIGWLALTTHLSLYWNGRQLFWMPEPGSWVETLNWTSQMGAGLMIILVAPVLVEFLRWVARSIRQPKAAG